MTDEKKSESPENDGKSCCSHKGGCCCRGRCGCRVLMLLLLAAAGVGLFQAGKCSARRCAMPPAAAVSAPAVAK